MLALNSEGLWYFQKIGKLSIFLISGKASSKTGELYYETNENGENVYENIA